MSTLENIEIVQVDRPPETSGLWSAIIGGAIAASAVSLALTMLGAGLGLSVVSPWTKFDNVQSIAVTSVIWLIVVQWVAAAAGGYLTGRMQSESPVSDASFFLDTASGFLAWALATLIAAAVLASATTTVVNATARAAAGGLTAAAGGLAATTQAASPGSGDPVAYFADMLLRPLPGSHPETTAVIAVAPNMQTPAAQSPAPDLRAEVGRVLAHGLAQPEFPPADINYLADMVAARTGLAPDAAKTRVDDVIGAFRDTTSKMRAAADMARYQAAKLAIYVFLSLIIGAFIASAAAALGGMHRNDRPAVAPG